MLLYHFTDESSWEGIRAEGQIRSYADLADDGSPWDQLVASLVWLTSNPAGWSSLFASGAVRITVDVSATAWLKYAKARSIPKRLRNSGGDQDDEWFVVEGSIPSSAWIVVEQLPACAVLWPS